MLQSATIMGRKKSYKPKPNPPKNDSATAPESDDEVRPDPANTVIVTTAEVAETATTAAAAMTGQATGPNVAPEPEPAIVTGRPEWAQVAPGRLEAAEDESFWYAFSLAVMACAPPVLGAPAALLASILAGRILRALWSVPSDVAPEDLGSARTMLFLTAVLAVGFKLANGGAGSGIIWIMVTVFFFNALHNVRMMVNVALKGGKKKKRELEQAKG